MQPIFQMFSSNHPPWCSDYDLHHNGKSQGRDGVAHHFSSLRHLPVSGTDLSSDAELEVLGVGFDRLCYSLRELEEIKCCPLMQQWPEGISKIYEKDIFSFLAFCTWCQMRLVCSKHPKESLIPAFRCFSSYLAGTLRVPIFFLTKRLLMNL